MVFWVYIHRVRIEGYHFIFDYNFRISRSIFILFAPMETGMNTPQSHVIAYFRAWWRHNCDVASHDSLTFCLHVKINHIEFEDKFLTKTHEKVKTFCQKTQDC